MELNRTQGKTIIIVTHDMQVIARYAKRVVIMSGSRIICDESTVDAFKETEILRKAFVEPPQIVELAHALNQEYPNNGFSNVLRFFLSENYGIGMIFLKEDTGLLLNTWKLRLHHRPRCVFSVQIQRYFSITQADNWSFRVRPKRSSSLSIRAWVLRALIMLYIGI